MMIFKKAIQRRAFIKGAGAAIALPFLDAMVPALAATAGQRPFRIGYVYLPTGRIMDHWIPTATGSDYELTPTLAPMAKHREEMLVLSGLDVTAGNGSHSGPCASYMTGITPSKEFNTVGISVDQIIAKQLGQETTLASMELGIDPPEWAGGAVDGLSGYYTSTISWRTESTPLPRQVNPRNVFERLFGDTDTLDPEALRRRMESKSSVLDSVSDGVKRLMTTVGSGDQHKLQEYFDAVRDIERGIEVTEAKSENEGYVNTDIMRPAGIPNLFEDHANLMFDMILLAYQTDMTRMISFMLGHEGSDRNYLELGAKDGHHSLTHHKGRQEAIDLVKKIELHQSDLLSKFISKMKATNDGEGSLLDNTIIIAGGAHSDSNLHLHTDVPTLVFGGSQKNVKGGRHIRYDSEPVSNLHLAVMDMANVSSEEYLTEKSDATGILKGLTG
ncbi:MAG: DUF1552 domain-containing protein [Gammaproteobacteria bacterium]|jgi:hypothetical protein